MEVGRLSKRRRLTTELNGTQREITVPSYFDSLPLEVVPGVVDCLRYDARKKWHPFQLFLCEGVFGDTVRASFTKFNAKVLDIDTAKSNDYEALQPECDEENHIVDSWKEDKIIVLAWRRCFVPENNVLIESCRYLRSLSLTVNLGRRSLTISLDSLFSACGDTLQELKIEFCGTGLYINSITESIARHCCSLHTLSLDERCAIPSLLPLFRVIGAKLRKLCLFFYGEQPLVEISKCCPVLEDVQIFGRYISFAMELRSSLQVVRFYACPAVESLTALIHQIPTVKIHLHALDRFDDFEKPLHFCGAQLQGLHIHYLAQPSADFGDLASTLVNLEELTFDNEFSDDFLDAFFRTPKPKLRKLVIHAIRRRNVLNYLASKISTLEVFSCSSHRTNFFGDIDLFKLLSTNKNLRELSILYLQRFDRGNIRRDLFVRRTAALIQCLNKFPSVQQLEIDVQRKSSKDVAPEKMIVEACMGLRRGMTDVQVEGIQYLQK